MFAQVVFAFFALFADKILIARAVPEPLSIKVLFHAETPTAHLIAPQQTRQI